MKYVSIDTETTGLNIETCDIIEFGAVVEDTKDIRPLDELPRFHTYILPPRKDSIFQGEPFALSMHSEIFKRIAERRKGYNYIEPHKLGYNFRNWLIDVNVISNSKTIDPITVAGKNFASFDLQFLKKLPDFKSLVRFHHRSLDPAILFWKPLEDSRVPNLEACLKRAGIQKPVLHTAIEDALLVIELFRKFFSFVQKEHSTPALTPERATELLSEHFATLTPEQFTQNLKQSGITKSWVQELPWSIVRRGSVDGGVFEIVSSQECEDTDMPWFFGNDAEAFFQKTIPTVVDYFETKEDAEAFLNQFASPISDMSLQKKAWPTTIEVPLRKWYDEIECDKRKRSTIHGLKNQRLE